jgi:hypothetical protein
VGTVGQNHHDVVAFADDLMDRSRLSGALPGIRFARTVDDFGDPAVVIIDLARYAELVRALRSDSSTVRIVAFGAHVDDAAIDKARSDGADLVLPRSRFFRDPAATIQP